MRPARCSAGSEAALPTHIALRTGTGGGFVALLDVLGFRGLVGALSSDARLDAYLNAVSSSFHTVQRPDRVRLVLYSDSIVMTTETNSERAFRVLLRSCSLLFSGLLQAGVPVRGAISHGPYQSEHSEGSTFIAGRPIVEAHDLERKQDWIGVMLAPSVLSKQPGLPGLCEAPSAGGYLERLPYIRLVQPASIPFHGYDHPYDGLAVVPTPGEGPMAPHLDLCVRQIEALKRLAPSPREQRKYDATLTWLLDLKFRWEDWQRRSEMPPDVAYW
jgi:hypothetical protein